MTWLQVCEDMGDDTDTLDIAAEGERDEDLITLLYLLAVLICVIMGQSAVACLYVIALLSVADVVCNM